MNSDLTNRNNETKSLAISIIIVAVLIVGVIGASYAYFAAYVTGTAVTTGTVTSKTVDNCIAQTITASELITANQTNFAEGAGNLTTSSTVANVVMKARQDAAARCCYTAKLSVNASGFSVIQAGITELELNIMRNGTLIVNRMDVTAKSGTYYLTGGTVAGNNVALLGTTSVFVNALNTTQNSTTYDRWSAVLTFKNNSFSQNANAGKSANVVLTLTPSKTVAATAAC